MSSICIPSSQEDENEKKHVIVVHICCFFVLSLRSNTMTKVCKKLATFKNCLDLHRSSIYSVKYSDRSRMRIYTNFITISKF